jgi:hypothetical protein
VVGEQHGFQVTQCELQATCGSHSRHEHGPQCNIVYYIVLAYLLAVERISDFNVESIINAGDLE